jgi:hypothetical protein
MLAFPSQVAAEKFTGRNDQDKLVRLFTHPDRTVRSFAIRWETHFCNPPGEMAPRWTGAVEPFDRSHAGFFKDHFSYVVHYTDADVRFVTDLVGRQRSETRWAGQFKLKAFIDRHEGPSNTCTVRRMRWTANRH